MDLIETNKENSNFQPNTAATHGSYPDSAKLSEAQIFDQSTDGRPSLPSEKECNGSTRKQEANKWKPKLKVRVNPESASNSNSKGSEPENLHSFQGAKPKVRSLNMSFVNEGAPP